MTKHVKDLTVTELETLIRNIVKEELNVGYGNIKISPNPILIEQPEPIKPRRHVIICKDKDINC